MEKPACGRCNFQGGSQSSKSSTEILCLIDATWHEDSYSCKHWSKYVYHLPHHQRVQLAIARKNDEDAERRHRETLEHLAKRVPPINITMTQTQQQSQSQNQAQEQQTTLALSEEKPTPRKRFFEWFLKHIQAIIIGVVIVLFGAWATHIYGPKADRASIINIPQPEPQVAKLPVLTAPIIRVTPTRFEIYKPSRPQVSGQEKALIQVKVSNDSSLHAAYQVHVRFLTDDGLVPHRADSDEWNALQGTPSRYTFDLPRSGFKKVDWSPDIPENSQALYSVGRARFTLAIHVSWEDLQHQKYGLFDMFELAYNRELRDFILEKKVGYNSFFDGEKMYEALGKWAR